MIVRGHKTGRTDKLIGKSDLLLIVILLSVEPHRSASVRPNSNLEQRAVHSELPVGTVTDTISYQISSVKAAIADCACALVA